MGRDYMKQRAKQITPDYREKKRVREGNLSYKENAKQRSERYYNKKCGTTRTEREKKKELRRKEVAGRKEKIKKDYALKKRLWEHRKNYKKDKCCEKCGYNKVPKILCFHHIDPKNKKNEVSKIKRIESWIEEVKKCIILCPNCHGEIHNAL